MTNVTLVLRAPEHHRLSMYPDFEKAAEILQFREKGSFSFSEGTERLEMRQSGETSIVDVGCFGSGIAKHLTDYRVRFSEVDGTSMVILDYESM